MRYKLLPFLISLCLAVIPFFWLKPGWVDLGGDSSRLYFYDPLNYLKSFPLYVIAPTGTSVLMIGHHLIPFGLLLYVLKLLLLNSSYLLITLFNGMQLVVAFLSIYFITKELLQHKDIHTNEKSISILASTIAGLFYILSPVLSPNGWDKSMIVHNQLFLNPLIFFLLLRSLHTKKIVYILLAFLVTFFFASNFSPGPPPFAFFPLVLFYLLLYAIFVNKTAINFRKIILVIFLFIALHSFHLVPQGMLFFGTEDNAYRQAALTYEGKIDRGLGYFTAVASTYRFIDNITSLPQGQSPVPIPKALEPFWFIFPASLIIGFLLNKRRKNLNRTINNNFLLLGFFFLITLFLATANVTSLGFAFYKSLFNIPGFSMFRNYYGQFSFVFIFFYALLLGHALFYIFEIISTKRKMALFLSMAIFISISSWPFIKGDMINLVLNKGFEPEVHVPIKMDPTYEKFLSYIRNNPIDSKLLSFPLTEGGHQILAGEESGAYDGPSTISYLTGKVDFAGRSGLNPFGELFLRLARNKDYESLKTLLSLINVKYIFYNSDPYIFGEHFYRIPPYQEMHKYLPTNQSSYKVFLEQLGFSEKIDFGDKYHLYKVKETNYLPHLYVAKSLATFNGSATETRVPLFSNEDRRIAFMDKNVTSEKDLYPIDTAYLAVKPKSATLDAFKNNPDAQMISTTVPIEIYPALLPFLALPQKAIFPNEATRIHDLYFDKRIYSAEELIAKAEMENSIQETMLAQYKNLLEQVIHDLTESNEINLRRILNKHENRLVTLIRKSILSDKEKLALTAVLNETLEGFQNQLNTTLQSVTLRYVIDVLTEGFYEVYVKKDDIEKRQQKEQLLTVDGKRILPQNLEFADHWIQFDDVFLSKKENTILSLSMPYYIDDREKDEWKILGERESAKATNLVLDGPIARDYVGAIVSSISQWEQNALYLISFDYQVGNTNGTLTEGSWQTYRAVLESGEDATSALLQIVSGQLGSVNPSNPPNLEIKNLSVIKVPYPDILLRKREAPLQKEKEVPQITFTKINPTKYRIKLRGAKEPFTLIFSEAFNRDWKLFSVDDTKGGLNDKTVASYFGGDIQEGKHTSAFLDAKTFEGWGKRTIAQDRHFIANGYANGWYILPSDTDDKAEYTLVLEMTFQRVFYIAFAISLIAVAICCLWVIVLLSKPIGKRING